MPSPSELAGDLRAWLAEHAEELQPYGYRHHQSLEDQYVEDPVVKVRFPKFAAGATLEHKGQTYYFVDDRTKAEFAQQQGLAAG